MKYTYATLILEQSGAEINENNISAVLDAAGAEFSRSTVRAHVAALEDTDASGDTPAEVGQTMLGEVAEDGDQSDALTADSDEETLPESESNVDAGAGDYDTEQDETGPTDQSERPDSAGG